MRIPAPPETPLRAIPGTEQSRLVVEVTAIRDGTTWRDAAGRCQLAVYGHLLGVRAGDRLRIFGQLSRPGPPRNPGQFDYAAHARSDQELVRLRSAAPPFAAGACRPSDRQPGADGREIDRFDCQTAKRLDCSVTGTVAV